ncbi:MAG TPA: hypothetical protein VGG28_24195 [Kofleriaceae bacterium]
MNVWLLHRDRDFDSHARLPPHAAALTQDLGLDVVLHAMAADDPFVLDVARQVVLAAVSGDVDTIRYRQAILRDCMSHASVVRDLYRIAVDGVEAKRKHWIFGITSRFPSSVLGSAVELMKLYATLLRQLRGLADAHARDVTSEGLRRLFAMFAAELSDDYLARVDEQLDELEFRDGVLVSAELGDGNETANEVLRRTVARPSRLERWFGLPPAGYTVKLAERDDAGARALGRLRDAGINRVANALAQSVEHVESFFALLRAELAFYLGCSNLHARLGALSAPTCAPDPAPLGSRERHAHGLYDPSLAIESQRAPVANELAADGASLLLITGANQGGKTTFLRAVGIAQLMMHAGMFVAADSFGAEVHVGLFTHWKREEDVALNRGKLDEELHRVSVLADAVVPDALVLFNESFASTNEREGSEIARQIVRALVERRVVVAFVTHLYDFARTTLAQPPAPAVFLRAERRPNGTRSFKLVPGEPLATSFGQDLYARIFGA